MSYPVIADVKTYMGVTTSDDDARITQMMTWTENQIHDYLGRNLNSDTYTQKNFEPNSGILQLKNYPVDSITSVDFDGDTKETSDFDLDEDYGTLHGIFTNVTKVTTVYVGGYATLPVTIEDVFYHVVEDMYNDYLSGGNTAEIKDVTLFDFAKVSYDTSTISNSSSISYSGVESKGYTPEYLRDYLGILNMYRSNFVLAGLDGC